MKILKNSAIFLVIAFMLATTSCARFRRSVRRGSKNDIPALNVSLSSLARNDYCLLGVVKAESTITVNGRRITGDTMKCGYVKGLNSAGDKYESIALGNATYILIEKANKLGADAVILPHSQIEVKVEGRTRTVKVIVYAKAIKYKPDSK